LTDPFNTSIMEILKKRTTDAGDVRATPVALDRQSGQLLTYLDALFQRMMLRRRTGEEPAPDCSREEMRALVILGPTRQTIMSTLADALDVPLSTATHTVDRLVAKGLVVRSRSEQDRRVVQVEMSDYGRKLQDAFRDKRREMARSWLEPLSQGEREIFLELMDKIHRLAKPAPEPAPHAPHLEARLR